MSNSRVADCERSPPLALLALRWPVGWLRSAAQPVDIAWLAAFRIAFGGLLTIVALRSLSKGWVHQFFELPSFHFSYPGFAFVHAWPQPWMRLHFAGMALLALGIATGCYYRLCCLGFLLAFTYVELIDQSLYLNHYYLVTLLTALLCVLPAHGKWSVDAWRQPRLVLDTVPRAVLWTLRLQVAVVYVFAGLGKLNAEWLLEAQPLKIWLAMHGDWPFVGHWLQRPEAAYVASWSGALFDLSIVFALSRPRLAKLAWPALLAFHVLTALLFPIGVFPWLMTLAAGVFLEPDAVRRAVQAVRDRCARWLPWVRTPEPPWSLTSAWRPATSLRWVLAVHCVLQVSVPVWQHCSNPNSAWTAHGFNFAWKVMLVQKAGAVSFRACDRGTALCQAVLPAGFLAPFQAAAMAQDPYLILAAAREVGRQQLGLGHDVAVYADAFLQVNGQPTARLIDQRVDLTRADLKDWILPRPAH